MSPDIVPRLLLPDGWGPRVIHPRGFDFFLFRTKSSFSYNRITLSVRLSPRDPRCRFPRDLPRISTFFFYLFTELGKRFNFICSL